MADAGARRHDGEIGERLLAPFQEAVALLVLLVFALDVLPQRLRRSEIIDDHGMVDDEIDGHQRIDLVGIAAERDHRIAHRRQIDDRGNAGEILHQHARRAERDLVLGLAPVVEPGRDGLDVFLLDRAAVLVAQQIFEHDLHENGNREMPAQTVLFGGLQREILVGLRADSELFRHLKLSRLAMRRLRNSNVALGSRRYRYNRGERLHKLWTEGAFPGARSRSLMRLSAQKIALERGGRRLFSGLSFQVGAGEALVAVGPNGAGKSSLLRAIAGFLPLSEGSVVLQGGDAEASLGEQAHCVGHADALKGALTAGENSGVLGRRPRRRSAPRGLARRARAARPRPCRRFSGARAVGGPEAASRARAAARRAAAAVAARRAHDRARRGCAESVRRSDARASRRPAA